ncbi:DUF1206 domain-containing protein [soil metagenome]
MARAIEIAARIGYGAQGFVYVSAGLLTVLAAFDILRDAAGSQEATYWLARQPFGPVWLMSLGLGLTAFAAWCLLQAVFDADHEGRSRSAVMKRMGQGTNGVVHAALAVTAFSLMFAAKRDLESAGQAGAHDLAATVLAVPFGDAVLIAVGLGLVVSGLTTAISALREDFTDRLTCSEAVCRRLAPLGKAGNVARGISLIPLGAFVCLGGLHSRASEVRTFGDALDGLADQPGGGLVLALTGVGLVGFGIFSFIEARFRRIRTPRDLALG